MYIYIYIYRHLCECPQLYLYAWECAENSYLPVSDHIPCRDGTFFIFPRRGTRKRNESGEKERRLFSSSSFPSWHLTFFNSSLSSLLFSDRNKTLLFPPLLSVPWPDSAHTPHDQAPHSASTTSKQKKKNGKTSSTLSS